MAMHHLYMCLTYFYIILLAATRGKVKWHLCLLVLFVFVCVCTFFWKYLLATNPVPEFFSHNTKSSHPELSALDSLSSRGKQKLGNAFRVRGEKPPESTEMSPDTYSTLLRVTQQRELKDATQNLKSAILNQWQITWECITPCYPNTIRSRRALNLFGFVSR